ncbi:MAG: type II toxin-antitoxin system RelE/ParE family toxin [bacterium]|nr:type II toxin-antitoxin system RelE/ParE family toxin [bacterium]
MFKIFYHYLVTQDDIPKLSTVWKKNIRRAIETKLITNPEVYGKPLRRSLKNYRKLRVGDYRVIFRIDGSSVKIFVIQHRSIVYSVIEKRIGV